MTKKEAILNKKPFAYWSGCGGVELYHIEYGIEDHIYCTSNSWHGTPRKKPHKVKIKYDRSGNAYFMIRGYKAMLSDCIRI